MPDQLSLPSLFKGLPKSGRLLVAVSGGGDSLALLYLSSAWAKQHDIELFAATVDHGLRPEAGAEAAFVSSVCASLGIPHKILEWQGQKPGSGISALARDARYGLLETHAASIDTQVIMTGHTLDDQAETVAMRLDRTGLEHSGRGLAGMARRTRLPRKTILYRPLLGLTRQELRNYLNSIGQPWIEDPTNQDQSYERVRVRKYLTGKEDEIRQLGRFSSTVGRLRALQNDYAVELLQKTAHWEEGLAVQLSGFLLVDGMLKNVQVLALQIVVGIVGGCRFLPQEAAVRRFLENPAPKTTFGSCVIERLGDDMRVFREKRNLPVLTLMPGESAIWDGRIKIRNISEDEVICGPCSEESILEIEKVTGERFSRFKRASLSSSLELQRENGGKFLPFTGLECEQESWPDVEISLVAPAIEHFCPEFDWNLVDWLTRFKQERLFASTID